MHKLKSLRTNGSLAAIVLIAVATAIAAMVLLMRAPVFSYAQTSDGVMPVDGTEIAVEHPENRLLDEARSKAAKQPVMFDMPTEWTYGDAPEIGVPRVEHESDAGELGGELNITLTLDYEIVATNIARRELVNYVNKYMPAGEYKVVFATPSCACTVGSTHSEWWNAAEHSIDTETFYESATYSFEFTVLPAAIPEKYIADANGKLLQSRYEYVYDGAAHFYSPDIELEVLSDGETVYDRGYDIEGVYWSTEKADKYFGGFEILYNLYRMRNDHYHTAEYLGGAEEIVDCAVFAPVDAGEYTVYYMLAADNYLPLVDVTSDTRRDYVFYVTVVGVVDVPNVPPVIYNGQSQKGYVTDSQFYTVDPYNGWTDAGTYNITLRLRDPLCYMWNGQTLENRTETYKVQFTVGKASNDWVLVPDVVRWVEGEYDPDENHIVGESLFGSVVFEITDADGKVVYDSANGVNLLGSLEAGYYNFTATVEGSDNYNMLPFSKFIRVLEKQGLPWWGTLCITLGALALVAVVILILWKKGVFRLLTDKIVLSIRTKATVDATIAAVRANKVAAASKISVEQAEARDRAEERAQARKQALAEEKQKPFEEKVAALEAKAQAAADRAERMREKAEAMQARIESMKARAAETDDAAKPETGSTETASADVADDK